MIVKTRLSKQTRKRFDDEMKRVEECVRCEFVRAGLLPADTEGWRLPDGMMLLSKIPAHEEHRLSTVYFAAMAAKQTYDSLDGPRTDAMDVLSELVAAIERAHGVMHETAVTCYLHNAAGVGSSIAFQEEERIDSRELPAMQAALDWEALAKTARAARGIIKNLGLRRPAALKAYAAKGAGPFSHFCHELNKPVERESNIKERQADWESLGKTVPHDALAEPALPLDEIAEIARVVPAKSPELSAERWQDSYDQTLDSLRKRIARFDQNVNDAMRA